jgi:hypothetical protein
MDNTKKATQILMEISFRMGIIPIERWADAHDYICSVLEESENLESDEIDDVADLLGLDRDETFSVFFDLGYINE